MTTPKFITFGNINKFEQIAKDINHMTKFVGVDEK